MNNVILGTGFITIVDLSDPIISSTEPPSPVEDMLWLDISKTPPVLMIYKNGQWVAVSDTNESIPDNVPMGGYLTADFEINKGPSGAGDVGEIRVLAGKFIHPNGEKYNIVGNKQITTALESKEGKSRYILFIGHDSSRFTFYDTNTSRQFVDAEYINKKWCYYVDDNNPKPFEISEHDCVVGKVEEFISTDTNSGIKRLIKYYENAESVFEALTDGGAIQGIYKKDGMIFINAEYIKTGKLASVNGVSEFDLDNGKLRVGQFSGNHLSFDGAKLSINASEINIGSNNVVTEDIIDGKIDNIEIGGRNLILGSEIPKIAIGNNTINQCSYFYNLAGTTDDYKGKTVTISYDYEISGSTKTGSVFIRLDENPWSHLDDSINLATSPIKGHRSKTITISTNMTSARIGTRADDMQGSVTFSNMKLEKGNKATDWTPAPEDIDNSIGKGVTKVDNMYYLSTSSTSLAGGIWQTKAPEWINGRYMWSKTVTTLSNGEVKETPAICIAGAKGDTGSTGAAGKDAYTVVLTNESHSFITENNGSINTVTSTTTGVVAYKGSASITPTIGALPNVAGLTLSKNGTTITVQANTGSSLADSGTFTIPITVDGQSFSKIFSWTKTKKGATGNTGNTGAAGKDAYTVVLTNESHSFITENNGSINTVTSTTTEVVAYKGSASITPTIGALPNVAGLTLSKNGTTITVQANTGSSLADSGTFTIPITVDGQSFSKIFSWTKTKKGATGNTGANAQYVIVNGEQVFKYVNNFTGVPTPASITLTAIKINTTTTGKWQFKNASGAWVDWSVGGVIATDLTLSVGPTSGILNTAKQMSIRYIVGSVYDEITIVKVSDGATGSTGNTGSTGSTGAAGKDAYTVILTNESHTFAGSTNSALTGSARCEIIAYKGATKVSATIGSITGLPTGMTVPITNNGTVSAYFSPTVTTAMTTLNGILTIPITVDGHLFTKNFTYSLALKGSTGAPGANYLVFTTNYNYTQADINAYSSNGYVGTWTVNEAPSLTKAGDTVSIRVYNTTKACDSFIVAKVNSIASSTAISTTSIGLLENGSTGNTGTGVESITELYKMLDTKAQQPKPTSDSGWVTTCPTWSTGKYIHTCSKIVYKNPTSTVYTMPVCDSSWEAVNEIEIGGRNLLKNSGVLIPATSDYLVKQYQLAKPSELNKTYTFVLKAKVSSNATKTWIGAYLNSSFGANYRFSIQNKGSYVVYTGTFTITDNNSVGRNSLNIYCGNQELTGTCEIEWCKLVEGNRTSADWTPAPEDIDKEIKEVSDALGGLDRSIKNAFGDGIINDSEAKAIASNIQVLDNEKADIDREYTTIYGNTKLAGTAKTNLYNAKVAYDSSHSSLKSGINTATSDKVITDAERNSVNSFFSTYRTKLADYKQRIQEALDYITTKKVEDIEVGGRNYALSSSDEIAITGYYGTYKLSSNKSDMDKKPVMVSFDAKKEAGSKDVNMYAYFRGSVAMLPDSNKIGNVTDKYQRYFVTLPPSESPGMATHIAIHSGVDSCKLFIKNAKVEKGNKATDWTPAPEDISQEIITKTTEVKTEITKTTDAISSKVVKTEKYISQLKQHSRCGDLGVKFNYSSFNDANNGELYLHGFNIFDNPSDSAAMFTFGGVTHALMQGMINPNADFGIGVDVYLCKLNSASNGTFGVYYDSTPTNQADRKYKYKWLISGTSIGVIDDISTVDYICFGQLSMQDAETFKYATLYEQPQLLKNVIGSHMTSQLGSRMSSAEQKITDSAIINTVESATEANGTKKFAKKSEITQLDESWTAKFTSSGGYNLVYNGDFKRGLEKWSINNDGNGGIAYNNGTSTAPSGHSVGITGEIGKTKYIYQRVEIDKNVKQYTISAYIHTSSSGNDGSTNPFRKLHVYFKDTNDVNTFFTLPQSTKFDTWEKVSITVNLPSSKQFKLMTIETYCRDTTKVVTYSMIQVEKGVLATEWCPNPNEIYDGITTIDKDGITVKGTNSPTFTQMSQTGFYVKKSDGTNLIAADANGLVVTGKIVAGSGSTVPDSALSTGIKNSITTAQNTANSAQNTANSAQNLANAMKNGKMIHTDPNFRNGNNNVIVYNNSGGTHVTVTRIVKTSDCPSTSTHCIEIKHTGTTTAPGHGGFLQSIVSRANAVFLQKFIAKIPTGYTLATASNSMGDGYTDKWLTPNIGTGKWEEYIREVGCGSTGSFSSGGHIYLNGGTAPTASAPIVWYLAYASVFDLTDNDERVNALNTSSGNWNNAYNRVVQWAYGAVNESTTINGGLVQTNTITSNQIAIGDFTNLCTIHETNNPSGHTIVTHSDGYKYFRFGGTTAGYHPIKFFTSKTDSFRIGDTFKIRYNGWSQSSTSTSWIIRASYTDGTWNNLGQINPGFTTADGEKSAQLKITSGLQANKVLDHITCFIETSNVAGYFYMRDISITRMATGELIVDGEITANKLSINSITSDKIEVNAISGKNITGGIVKGSFIRSITENSEKKPLFSLDSEGRIIGADIECVNLKCDNEMSTDILNVNTISNPEYSKCLIDNTQVYISSTFSTAEISTEFIDGGKYKSFADLEELAPRSLNGYYLKICLWGNHTENIVLDTFTGGYVCVELNGKTLNGSIRCVGVGVQYRIYGNRLGSTGSGTMGIIAPYSGCNRLSYRYCLVFEGCDTVIYDVKLYKSTVTDIKSGCILYTDRASGYISNVVAVNEPALLLRCHAMSTVYLESSSGMTIDQSIHSVSGSIITVNKTKQAGRKGSTAHTHQSGNAQIFATGVTWDTTAQSGGGSTSGGTTTTKTKTINATSADTWRSTVYNSWKKDGTVRQGNYGYGDCNGFWFFGSTLATYLTKNVTKVTIKISRQSGGTNAAVSHTLIGHAYTARPGGAPSYGSTIRTFSLATGSSTTLTLNSTEITSLKKFKGIGLKSAYTSSLYSVCSGSCSITITYTE